MKKRHIKKMMACLAIALALVCADVAVMPAINPVSTEVQAAASIKINKTKLTMYVKKKATLKISGTTAKVTWSSSNKKVAKVSSAGKVTALKKGTATITAKVGKKKYTCKVTVKNPVLSASKLSVLAGKTKTLKVTGATGTVKWVSGNSKIAKVSSKGVVTGVKPGSTTITATASGVKLSCKVTVKPIAVTGVTLNKTSASLAAGSKLTLKATVAPSNATNRSVTWETSNKTVAAVTSGGVVTAKTPGTATITVATADGNKKAACKITVKAIAAAGITLDLDKAVVNAGDTFLLTASVNPANATDKSVVWSSDHPDVCEVNEEGVVTAKKAGIATITAQTADGKRKASCLVTVKAEVSTGFLPVYLASEPYTLDPALNSSVDGATMICHLFSGLAKWTQTDNGTVVIVPDMAEELAEPVDNGDGTFTYTYTIRDDALWSDGQPVTAADFEYAWKRATTAALEADYAYLFEYIAGYPSGGAVSAEDNTLQVSALDDRTLEVTTNGYYAFWNELLTFPTFFPVRKDVVETNAEWATTPETYVTNGMYTLSAWEHDSVITVTKNENYPDAAEVTMPEIRFYLSGDAQEQLVRYQTGELLFVDEVDPGSAKGVSGFYTTGALGTYYANWSLAQDLSPVGGAALNEQQQAEVRRAISLLIDRNYIVNDIVQGGQVPASSFVAMGVKDADGGEFYQNAGHSLDYIGYYPVDEASQQFNYDQAFEILSKYYEIKDGKVVNFPELTYLINASAGHQAIAEYLQSALAAAGIKMSVTVCDWMSFLQLRQEGNYSLSRNGWIADYSDASSFLDMWITDSGSNDCGFGKGDHALEAVYNMDLSDIAGYEDCSVENGTWAETYDVLISWIQTEKNPQVRNQLMHKAEDLLMETGAVCPLYYYTDVYLLSDRVSGCFVSPLGLKFFMHTTINR